MVFGDCIAAGHPEFMRASRALQNDGEAIISRKGVCRLHFGTPNDKFEHRPCRKMTKEIQNLDIKVDMTDFCDHVRQGWDSLEPFADSKICREHCNIVLKVGCVENIDDGIELLRIFWRFKGFKKVCLRIEADVCLGLEVPCICMSRVADAGVERIHEFFASKLGEAEFINVKDSFCMTFEPVEQAKALAGGFGEQNCVRGWQLEMQGQNVSTA